MGSGGGEPASSQGGGAPGLQWRSKGPGHTAHLIYSWLICLFYCPRPLPPQAFHKTTPLPTARSLRGGVQSGEKTGHSPSDSSCDTLGASGAGSGWGRGGGRLSLSPAPRLRVPHPSHPRATPGLTRRRAGARLPGRRGRGAAGAVVLQV